MRYKGSADERYRSRFDGRFLADGATGTLSAHLLFRSPGNALPAVPQRHADLDRPA